MRKYKVYVRLNKEVFEISEDDEVVYRYEQDLGYALCDFIHIDINTLLSDNDNDVDLLKYSQVFLMTPQKSEYQYISDIYDIATKFILQGGKSVGCDLERAIHINIENINEEICKVMYPNTISDILLFLLYETVGKNIVFKKCKRCEKMFPVCYHGNVLFCERINEHIGKTCRQIKFNGDYVEYGSYNTQTIMDIYNKAYRRQRRRADRQNLSIDKFWIWSKKVRKHRDLCLNGKITIQEFEKWIMDNDRNYDEED